MSLSTDHNVNCTESIFKKLLGVGHHPAHVDPVPCLFTPFLTQNTDPGTRYSHKFGSAKSVRWGPGSGECVLLCKLKSGIWCGRNNFKLMRIQIPGLFPRASPSLQHHLHNISHDLWPGGHSPCQLKLISLWSLVTAHNTSRTGDLCVFFFFFFVFYHGSWLLHWRIEA